MPQGSTSTRIPAGGPEGGIINRNPAILEMRTKSQLVDFVDELFRLEGAAEELGIDAAKLRAFIRRVSRHYRQNPYHNFHHATDTVNTVGWMLSRPLLHARLPVHYRFLLMLAALIHDVEHPGNNNLWEVETRSALAETYAYEAVLEKHSFAVTERLLAEPALDLFRPFGAETAQEWLRIVQEIVLATDFATHRQFLDDFKAFMESHGPDFDDLQFVSWLARALMKAADIANTSKPFAQAQVWGQRVMMEFWAQGVLEKRNNMPVGPLNDPETVQVNAAQAGFIRFAALELFEILNRIDPELQEMVETLRKNLEFYEEKAERGDGNFE